MAPLRCMCLGLVPAPPVWAHFSSFQVRKTRKHLLITEFFCDFLLPQLLGICPNASSHGFLYCLQITPASTPCSFHTPPNLCAVSGLAPELNESSTVPAEETTSTGGHGAVCCSLLTSGTHVSWLGM